MPQRDLSRIPLEKALALLDKKGVPMPEDFPARLGNRAVRVVERLGRYVMIQPADDTRRWEIAPVALLSVNRNDLHDDDQAPHSARETRK